MAGRLDAADDSHHAEVSCPSKYSREKNTARNPGRNSSETPASDTDLRYWRLLRPPSYLQQSAQEIERIGVSSFYGCESLTILNIPDSTVSASLVKKAFLGCGSLNGHSFDDQCHWKECCQAYLE
eukprot:scaffold6701_cov63-Cylindrotheca_fusiformis.AAC.2